MAKINKEKKGKVTKQKGQMESMESMESISQVPIDEDGIPRYELGREIGIDFPRLDGWEKRFNLTRPRKP